MNSWYQLLLFYMAQGRYLQLGQPVTDFNWLVLRSLVWDMEQVRVSDAN